MASAPVTLSNNSHVAKVHVSGATLEGTFLVSTFSSLVTPQSVSYRSFVNTTFSSEGKIGDLFVAYVVPSLDAVKIINRRMVYLRQYIGLSSMRYDQ